MSGIDLNPKEVLEHLYELGYTNLTAEQLREFIKDLKKLIKYDMRLKEGSIVPNKHQLDNINFIDQDNRHTKDKSVIKNAPPCRVVSPVTAEIAESNMHRSKPFVRSFVDDRDQNSCNQINVKESVSSSDYLGSNTSEKQKTSSESFDYKTSEKWNTNQRPISLKENIPPSRSFIRPRTLTGFKKPGTIPNRCDPVALYHKYKLLWEKNKIPGEENHSGLRWNIREKMLGSQDQPSRSTSQASLDHVNRRRGTRM